MKMKIPRKRIPLQAFLFAFAAVRSASALTVPDLPPPVFADTSSKVFARGTDAQNEQIVVELANDAVTLLLR